MMDNICIQVAIHIDNGIISNFLSYVKKNLPAFFDREKLMLALGG